MQTPAGNEFTIEVASRPLQRPALEMVLGFVSSRGRGEQVERLLAAARAGRISLDGLLVALRDGELAGAVWSQRQPGRVASLFPPVAAHPEWRGCMEELLTAAIAQLEASDVRLAQALLKDDQGEDAQLLLRHGFSRLADLLYMVSVSKDFPSSPPGGDLELTPAPSNDLARLARICERTYEGTLDCPALNGVRTSDDVLAGYRAAGADAPPRWWIARSGGDDVGCLFLADHPDDKQCEIVYAGLAPEARGNGFGVLLARHAQWQTRVATRERLVLAVDAANAPAIAAYSAAGFVVWDRRCALMRIFARAGKGATDAK
ncbi:MAG TPA: GNAT family N-acetyltransferase [Pirellulales bacterium]|jgi:ribosomal protein S18 acetylase RimI-like enzyme